MDPTQLSQQIVQFLAPALPFLLGLGGKAAEEAAQKLGAAAWEQAKALWAKLKPNVQAKPAAQEAVTDLAANPQNEKVQTALQWQLEKLLAEDQALAREVQQILEAPAVRQVTAQGVRSVAIGGSASDSVIVTGDGNVIKPGRPPQRKE
ncbi:hypothetical protein [Chloroflexus sp.]|uniref:hypothetical protein n=1 Tax=Chloroflexus sp. TaxID=1904827 RepID=UPI004048EF8B